MVRSAIRYVWRECIKYGHSNGLWRLAALEHFYLIYFDAVSVCNVLSAGGGRTTLKVKRFLVSCALNSFIC